MALKATVYHFVVNVSDIDREFYERLDFRVARHPSESVRYLLTRILAYCLAHEPGIRFSKGGLSATDEPPLSVVDPTGQLLAWIDVGAPSAERLHRAAKAARRVALYTSVDLARLRKEAATRTIHRVEEIKVHCVELALLESLEPHVQQNSTWELVRTDEHVYINVPGGSFSGTVIGASLVSAEPPA
ncbi:MAG TPA: YaeQ family protein [Polyangiaceae bacterium]|nr:YaeQ family protein [Polyangiaceae bacterium]